MGLRLTPRPRTILGCSGPPPSARTSEACSLQLASGWWTGRYDWPEVACVSGMESTTAGHCLGHPWDRSHLRPFFLTPPLIVSPGCTRAVGCRLGGRLVACAARGGGGGLAAPVAFAVDGVCRGAHDLQRQIRVELRCPGGRGYPAQWALRWMRRAFRWGHCTAGAQAGTPLRGGVTLPRPGNLPRSG